MIIKVTLYIALIITLSVSITNAQDKINWISFDQLEDSLKTNPKKVFIDFYTDWCSYCRKMDKVIFTKQKVIEIINNDYYAIRFNAESQEEIQFGGQKLFNDQVKKSRNPIHQMAQTLALRDGQFIAPTLVILDKDFQVKARYFEYMDSKKLIKALNQ